MKKIISIMLFAIAFGFFAGTAFACEGECGGKQFTKLSIKSVAMAESLNGGYAAVNVYGVGDLHVDLPNGHGTAGGHIEGEAWDEGLGKAGAGFGGAIEIDFGSCLSGCDE